MPENRYNPRTHAVSWALLCATFPLIWVGGLVTTYDAGMAVPDWPNTYGYNLFLYPPASWLKVWDLFLEHSHRLIGSAVGMITIALCVMLWRADSRRWMKGLGVAALAGVSFQGVLGGLRVIGSEALLALVHGCTAPLFFGLTAVLVATTSPPWFGPAADQRSPRMRRVALAVVVGIYTQIVLGALIRHRHVSGGPAWFTLWVWLHLIVAALVAAGVVWLAVVAPRRAAGQTRVVGLTRLLAGLLTLQILLGLATWVVNFGFPGWFQDYVWAIPYTVVQEGPLQAWTTTAHVAFGSLNLIVALWLALWIWRPRATAPPNPA